MRPPASLNVERTTVPGGVIVKLSGLINETFRADMLADIAQECVVVDLDGVRWITSFGVREWIRALKQLPAAQVVFVNCRPAMVLQFNMIHGFAGSGQIVSFYLPYVCLECNEEIEVLTDLRRQFDVVVTGPQQMIACPSCGGRAEFDELNFLSYVQSQQKPNVSETLSKLIDGDLEPLRQRTFRIQKEIGEDVTAMWLSGPITHDLRLKRAAMGLDGSVIVLFDDISEIDPRGVVRLEALLFPEHTDVHLARVPPRLLEALDPALTGRLEGRVLSFSVPVSCRSCGRYDTVVDRLPEPDVEIECHRCGQPAIVVISRRLVEQELSRFYEPDPPAAIAGYLARRPNGPTLARKPSASEPTSIGRYQIIRQIGSGGMAEVFLARHSGPQGFEKKVVIKKILPRFARDPDFVRMFLREARLAARISHPNVVQVFELGDAGDEYFIAMEYVKGWSLDAILRALARHGHSFPIDLACRLIADVCAGLHAAHTCGDEGVGIIHRDMSPHNVLVSEQGSVKIVDFGISKAADAIGETKTGAVKGKVAYMAPEQVDRRIGPIDQRTDVLATGLVLFEVLTGKSAHRRDTEYRTMSAALECIIPNVTTLRTDIPEAVAAIVRRATARDAGDRYPSCRKFQLDLEDAIAASGRSCTSAHLAAWLEAEAIDAVKAGRLSEPGPSSQTGLADPDGETIIGG